jgi:hypothetical protein
VRAFARFACGLVAVWARVFWVWGWGVVVLGEREWGVERALVQPVDLVDLVVWVGVRVY